MAIDTSIVFAGNYPDKESAEADYELVKELFGREGLVDAYDAAIVERREDGKVKLGKKHETPTRAGGVLGAGVGLATGLVSPCSRSPRSAAASSRPPPPAAPYSARSPATPPPA